MKCPFDRAHLATFTGGDMALERDLLEDFVRNADSQLNDLQAAIGSAQWGECAHRLKGASSGVGMRAMAQFCGDAEALPTQQTVQARHLIRGIKDELDHLKVYLAATCDA